MQKRINITSSMIGLFRDPERTDVKESKLSQQRSAQKFMLKTVIVPLSLKHITINCHT
jgi:hypothetical protein